MTVNVLGSVPNEKLCQRKPTNKSTRLKKKSQSVVQKVMIVYVFSILPYIRN